MSATYTTTASILSWDEDRSLTPLPRVSPAKVEVSLPDLNGKLTSHYLITYKMDGNSTFVMADTVDVEVDGKRGTFVMEGTGWFNKTTWKGQADLRLVPDTLQGDLKVERDIVATMATSSEPGSFVYRFQID